MLIDLEAERAAVAESFEDLRRYLDSSDVVKALERQIEEALSRLAMEKHDFLKNPPRGGDLSEGCKQLDVKIARQHRYREYLVSLGLIE